MLITPICTSSIISIAATGTPVRSTLEAAAAASRIVGKVTTATLVSCGTTANLRVISVTIPSVPSEPIKRLVRLYPADDLLLQVRYVYNVAPPQDYLPWTTSRFDDRSVCKHNCQVDNPVLHRAISYGISPTVGLLLANHPLPIGWTHLQDVPTIPPILA